MLGSVRAWKVASNSVDEAEPHSSGRFCLPTFALSTPAFVVMLAKMGHCTPQQGGLRSEAGKRLARNALGDLLQALTKPGGFQLHIRFIQDTLYFLVSESVRVGVWGSEQSSWVCEISWVSGWASQWVTPHV